MHLQLFWSRTKPGLQKHPATHWEVHSSVVFALAHVAGQAVPHSTNILLSSHMVVIVSMSSKMQNIKRNNYLNLLVIQTFWHSGIFLRTLVERGREICTILFWYAFAIILIQNVAKLAETPRYALRGARFRCIYSGTRDWASCSTFIKYFIILTHGRDCVYVT